MSVSPPPKALCAPYRRATAPSTSPEPLTFTKVAISPPPSAVHSTDSEAGFCFSDVPGAGSELSRSPSLLTSLIRCQASRRSTSGTNTPPATTPGVSPQASPLPKLDSLPRTRPILRRSSTGAVSNDERPERPDLRLAFGNLESVRETPSPLQRKRSCLKFAVTPRPLPPATSTASSRRSSRTSPLMEALSLEEDDEEVATPWDSDDAGYQEDSEDGFSSDDDEDGMLSSHRWQHKSWKSWTPTAVPPPPILAPRGSSVFAPESTTDDADAPGPAPRRIRIRADDEDGKCSRHRSPPPASHVPTADPAPPAARSPSAYGLCRRRSGVTEAPTPNRGWRSDDATCRLGRLGRKTSLGPCVKFDANLEARKSQALSLARRESAPACVDEVHVLARQSQERCSVRGLRRVLGQ